MSDAGAPWLRRAIAAVARVASWVGPSAALAWAIASALCSARAGSLPSALAALFAAGLLALAACLLAIAYSLLLAALPQRWTTPSASSGGLSALGYLVIGMLGGALCVPPLRALMSHVVPSWYAYQEDIALVLALHAAVVPGTLLAWLAFRVRRQPGAFPLWIALPMYLAASARGAESFARFAPGRELWPALAELAFATLALAGVGERLRTQRPRWLFALAAPMLISLSTTLVALPARNEARATLAELYPGPAGVLVPLHAWFDLDGDGAAALFAGGDCDDARVEVAPDAIEIVGNGVDDNCIGGELTATAPEQALQRAEGRARNVVIVTIDTVRADRLDAQHMPQLNRVARDGVVFANAYASASYTTASMYAIMTGQLPMSSQLAWGQDLGAEPSIAELLHNAGYDTRLVYHRWLRPGVSWRGEAGFAQVVDIAAGQDAYRAVLGPEVSGQALLALQQLQAAHKPFLLWVHYVDPHAEQVPRANTPFSGRDDGVGRYDQEVFATDRELGKLTDALERTRFFDDGLLVVHSDHGEHLGEHGRWGHALWLSPEVMHALLVVRGKDVPAARIATRVRLVDIYPTVLEHAAGIRGPAAGASLASVWQGRERADRDVFAYTIYPGAWQRAALVGSHALRQDLLHGAEYVYDLARDPQQRVNIVEREPALHAALLASLGATWDRTMNDRVIDHHGRVFLRMRCAGGDRNACAALQRGKIR